MKKLLTTLLVVSVLALPVSVVNREFTPVVDQVMDTEPIYDLIVVLGENDTI